MVVRWLGEGVSEKCSSYEHNQIRDTEFKEEKHD
tara:strand:- start:325 stop:426 length:102 start_codon:yes stop_codon:yes gene_type:complete